MKVAIMQPYFLPYIGYYQLIAAVDLFILYDNIKYTKKGWINRNRMLQNSKDAVFSLPLKSDSDFLHIRERRLASDFDRDKFLNQITGAYRRAPHFSETFAALEPIIRFRDDNLFAFLHNAIASTSAHLGLQTKILVSSSISIDHDLKNQDKVLALCAAVSADTYVNAIGGTELYSKDAFAANGVALQFLKSTLVEYPQFGGEFVPWLSILDVLMFNSVGAIRERLLDKYEFI